MTEIEDLLCPSNISQITEVSLWFFRGGGGRHVKSVLQIGIITALNNNGIFR